MAWEILLTEQSGGLAQAILLLGGSKAGQWRRWYEKNIPIADSLYDEHLENRS